jgi:hypothetical protein
MLHVKQSVLWPIPVYERARADTAAQVQLEVINLINEIDPLPMERFNIRVTGARGVLDQLREYAEVYGRLAGIQLWFDVESVRG